MLATPPCLPIACLGLLLAYAEGVFDVFGCVALSRIFFHACTHAVCLGLRLLASQFDCVCLSVTMSLSLFLCALVLVGWNHLVVDATICNGTSCGVG